MGRFLCHSSRRPARAYNCIVVCTQQIQFWKIAAVTFDILYILCTLNRVLRPILGDRFILMCRSWYSGVDLLEFHGQSKLFSHIYFLRFLGIIRKKKIPSFPPIFCFSFHKAAFSKAPPSRGRSVLKKRRKKAAFSSNMFS